MFRKIRFYTALTSAFIRKGKKKITLGFVCIILTIFFLKIVIPLVLPILANVYYELKKPSFIEGVVGEPVYPNPLFDSNKTQKDISKLIYRGLTKVDTHGNLVPDLAENYKKVSDTEYIFNLKRNIYWHDGVKFTADDVVYTVEKSQDPENASVIADNFTDVSVIKINNYSIKFLLKEPFSPFPLSTTVGVIPKHVPLKKYKPIGTGVFQVKQITPNKLVLTTKKINLVFKFYTSFDQAKIALKLGEIHALGGFSPQEVGSIKAFGGKKIYQKTLPFRQTVVFFNTRADSLNKKEVRQALSYAVDKRLIKDKAGGKNSITAKNQLGLPTSSLISNNERYSFDLETAKNLLTKAKYKNIDGKWQKDNKKITVNITTADDYELNSIASFLKDSWVSFGINVKTTIVDAEKLRKDIIPNQKFEILVDFQDISPDPDQYVLWHTSQIHHANITGIKSPKLENLLEEARKMEEKNIRVEKNKLFTKLLLDESPAIFLYHPQYIWAVSNKVEGVSLEKFANPVDRFNSYNNWKINSE